MIRHDSRLRSKALQYLVKRQEREVIPQLIEIYRTTKSRRLQAEIIAIFTMTKDPRALDFLIITLRKTRSLAIKKRVMIALRKIGGKTARDAMIPSLVSRSSKLRKLSWAILKQMAPKDSWKWRRIMQIRDRSPAKRKIAIEHLAQRQVTEALPAIVSRLRDPSPQVRTASVKALGKLRVASSFNSLFYALKREKSAEIRQQVYSAMAQIDLAKLPTKKRQIYEKRSDVKLILAGVPPQHITSISESKFSFKQIGDRLWNAYRNKKTATINTSDLAILSQSTNSNHLDTVAAIYASNGNREKAMVFAKKGIKETPRRVELLLEGKTPQQVEDILKK